MDRTTFDRYIAAYNSGDMQALAPFYTDDVVFENFGDRHEGAELRDFIAGLHQVIRDRFDPVTVLIDGDAIAMEAVNTITALRDLPDLPAGPMSKGTYSCRMFVFYTTQGDRIRHVRVAGWPPIPV